MELLQKLCSTFGPSGNESQIKKFILNYVFEQENHWKNKPEIIHENDFQDCLILKFGNPRTAIFAHIDTIGFTVRYEDQLVPIGSPEVATDYAVIGEDSLGAIECKIKKDENDNPRYVFGRTIDTGTNLVYKCNFVETDETIQSCYLDNRLGVYSALKVAENLQDGIIVFSCWEEHGGGSVPFLTKYIYERWNIRNALISDITWVTEGVQPGNGVVISLRDHNIPRQSFVNRIIKIAQDSKIPYQLEVEGGGSSDGREVQLSPYPIDWCFIGAPELNVHSPNELVNKKDILSMIELYNRLMMQL